MNPRPQTAGTAGIIAGVLLAVLLILFMTSGMRPEAMADPGKMMAYAGQNAGRWRNMAFLGILTTIAAVFYFPGLAARLRDRDRKSTRLNSSHRCISYAVFCLKKK